MRWLVLFFSFLQFVLAHENNVRDQEPANFRSKAGERRVVWPHILYSAHSARGAMANFPFCPSNAHGDTKLEGYFGVPCQMVTL